MKDWTHTIALVFLALLLAWNSWQDCQRWKISVSHFDNMEKQVRINQGVIDTLGAIKNARR